MASLFRHRDFRHLWTGSALGHVGSQLSGIALPVLAVAILEATEWQMGVLAALSTAAFLVLGLPAGALVDRMRKRNVLVVADLVRALALSVIVVAAFTGHASMTLLYVTAFIMGCATVFFDVAHQSYIPLLVGADHIVDGNAKIQTTESLAQVGGPALAGQLLRWVSAPALIGANAVTYLLSALAIWRITAPETPHRPDRSGDHRPSPGRALVAEIGEGLRFVFSIGLLVRMVACTAIGNLGWGIAAALEAVYILRFLGISEATMGLMFSVAAVGGLAGALSSNWLTTRIGQARIIPLTALGMAVPMILLPVAASTSHPAIVMTIALFGTFFTMVLYNIATVSFRQRLCPPELLGRMNASVRFIIWGTTPIGGLLGGWLGTTLGLVPSMWIAVALTFAAAVPVAASSLWRMTTLPTLHPRQDTLA